MTTRRVENKLAWVFCVLAWICLCTWDEPLW